MREATAEIESVLGWFGIRKSSRRRDTDAGTRDECATRWIRSIVFRLHFHVSWLEGEPQHLDRGRHFDVLIANDEIERSIAGLRRATGCAPLPSGRWRRRRRRRNSLFFPQGCAVKRAHAVHFGVQQDIHEHLYLGELLSDQRRHGCFWQSGGKFIETEGKFVWEFHVVRVRSI